MVLDTGFINNSMASEIIARVSIYNFKLLKSPPIRLAMPDIPEPTSLSLTKDLYIRANVIAKNVLKSLKINHKDISKDFDSEYPSDVPDSDFTGPF